MEIRFARETDSRQLLEIYRQYIDTTVTFEYVLPTEEEFAGRIREIGGEYPYLVCEEGGRAVGYAYAHKPFERAAYQWDAELSIYLDREYRGDGLGRRLYGMLMEILIQHSQLQSLHHHFVLSNRQPIHLIKRGESQIPKAVYHHLSVLFFEGQF